jgi:hypothetical protein
LVEACDWNDDGVSNLRGVNSAGPPCYITSCQGVVGTIIEQCQHLCLQFLRGVSTCSGRGFNQGQATDNDLVIDIDERKQVTDRWNFGYFLNGGLLNRDNIRSSECDGSYGEDDATVHFIRCTERDCSFGKNGTMKLDTGAKGDSGSSHYGAMKLSIGLKFEESFDNPYDVLRFGIANQEGFGASKNKHGGSSLDEINKPQVGPNLLEAPAPWSFTSFH